jgi:site-specific recombinase XerD
MSSMPYIPIPVFDTREEVIEQYKAVYADERPLDIIQTWLTHCFKKAKINIPSFAAKDYQHALNFLYSYRGSQDTFNAYRRDVERLLQWSWFVRNQSFLEHKREDIETFIEFCLKPPKRWISLKNTSRFKKINGEKVPNPEWRLFDVSVSKQEHKEGIKPDKDMYKFSQAALKTLFNVLSSFYNYLLQEQVVSMNPVALMRQKSKFLQKDIKTQHIRRLSNQQWEMVMSVAKEKALQNPIHERTVFMLTCLYGMYLRISELIASARWTPTMGDFFKDPDGHWWFKTVGKGNKARQIAVSHAMLNALQHYRQNYLKLSPLPSLNEYTPLIPHLKNLNKPVKNDDLIRKLVQECFDQAADQLESQGEQEEANGLRIATVHWLRHTGISEDVKHRPREHVRDDAGHSSGAITDKYIDVELRERAKSALNKIIDVSEDNDFIKVTNRQEPI